MKSQAKILHLTISGCRVQPAKITSRNVFDLLMYSRLTAQMPKSQIGTAAISSRSNLKSQSASGLAAEIAFKSEKKRVEIATEIAMTRNRCDFKLLAG